MNIQIGKPCRPKKFSYFHLRDILQILAAQQLLLYIRYARLQQYWSPNLNTLPGFAGLYNTFDGFSLCWQNVCIHEGSE